MSYHSTYEIGKSHVRRGCSINVLENQKKIIKVHFGDINISASTPPALMCST